MLGNKPLAQIKRSTVQAWLAGLQGAASTRHVALGTVSAILSAAVDDERISKNPCSARSVSAPRRASDRINPWSVERVASVAARLPDRYRNAAVLAAGLGLRQGEVFGLSPDDVDFLRGTVTIQRQVRQVRSRLVLAAPKGNKTRTIPLPSSVRDRLAAYLAEFPASSVTLPWRELDGEPTHVPLVMRGVHEGALNRNHDIWKPALLAAGVEPTRENGMHALRHHYFSVLLDAGESIKAVSEYLGHADAGFTLRVYTHLMPSSAERTRKAVDDAFACYMSATSNLVEAVD